VCGLASLVMPRTGPNWLICITCLCSANCSSYEDGVYGLASLGQRANLELVGRGFAVGWLSWQEFGGCRPGLPRCVLAHLWCLERDLGVG
jgi:hypothetical protein